MPTRSELRSRLGRSLSAGSLASVLPLFALALGLTVQAGYTVHLADRLWFFGDDWDFLLRRGVFGDYERSMWMPHNEHWSTVPIVLFRAVFAVFGLKAYLPYALLPIAAHVAIWTVMYALLRRIGVAPWPAATAVWAGAFLAGGVGAQNTLWDFQVGFLGSAVFGLLAILLVQQDPHWRLAVAWVALILALASSGIGLIFVGWACLCALVRRGMRRALIVGAIPGAAYGAWFALAGHKFESDLTKDITALPLPMVKGIDAVWSTALEMPGAGPAVLVGLIWVTFVRPHSRDAFALAASGMGALLLAFAIFAYARSGLDEDATTRSRYLYFGVLFCVPALGLAFSAAAERLRERSVAQPLSVLVLLVLTGALGLAHLKGYSDDRREDVDGLQQRVAATQRLLDEDALLLGQMPSPERNPDISVAGLEHAQVRDDFRDVKISRSDRLDARGQLQVLVSESAPTALPSAAKLAWNGFGVPRRETSSLDSCLTRVVTDGDAFLAVEVPQRGVSLALAIENSDEIETSIVEDGLESEPVDWSVDSERWVDVQSTAARAVLHIRLPLGKVTVCPRRPVR